MIHKIVRFYRKRQMMAKQEEFNRKAVIGPMFEFGFHAAILNESGEKDRIVIGHHCRLSGTLLCKTAAKIEIGNYSSLNDNARIECLNQVKIGHYVGIGDFTVITDNDGLPISPEERVKFRMRYASGGAGFPGLGDGSELSESAPVIIEDIVWIGANCVILKGVTLGEGSVVARNAVVTENVPPYTLVAGYPARVIKVLEKPPYQYYQA
jgi:acetyltransferase-like isoleucine patch superfamily enzyme